MSEDNSELVANLSRKNSQIVAQGTQQAFFGACLLLLGLAVGIVLGFIGTLVIWSVFG